MRENLGGRTALPCHSIDAYAANSLQGEHSERFVLLFESISGKIICLEI